MACFTKSVNLIHALIRCLATSLFRKNGFLTGASLKGYALGKEVTQASHCHIF